MLSYIRNSILLENITLFNMYTYTFVYRGRNTRKAQKADGNILRYGKVY